MFAQNKKETPGVIILYEQNPAETTGAWERSTGAADCGYETKTLE